MSRKKTNTRFPQRSAQALLILLLSASGGMILPQTASSQEDYQALSQAFEQRVAAFNAEKEALMQNATKVTFSQTMDIDSAAKSYPFLDDDLLDKATILTTIEKNKANLPSSLDLSSSVSVAESQDTTQGGVNIFLEKLTGRLWCGSLGCGVAVYVDQGQGYKKVKTFITDFDISVARANGQVALILSPPQTDYTNASVPAPAIWMLKNNDFVKEHEPMDQGYIKWKELELEQQQGQQGQTQPQ